MLYLYLIKAWFIRAIFIWQVFFDKFYLPVWTGKNAVFSLVKFTCLKPRKTWQEKTCQMKLVELRNLARVDANVNDKFFGQVLFDKILFDKFYLPVGKDKIARFSLVR